MKFYYAQKCSKSIEKSGWYFHDILLNINCFLWLCSKCQQFVMKQSPNHENSNRAASSCLRIAKKVLVSVGLNFYLRVRNVSRNRVTLVYCACYFHISLKWREKREMMVEGFTTLSYNNIHMLLFPVCTIFMYICCSKSIKSISLFPSPNVEFVC